jgi:hypothetical protein
VSTRCACVFLCVKPHPVMVTFAEKLADHYDVYCVCDDSTILSGCIFHRATSECVRFLEADNKVCKSQGFFGSAYWGQFQRVTAWDKVLYFLLQHNHHPYVWIVEEDVFIPSEQTLPSLDQKYSNADLLVNENTSPKDDPTWDWWESVKSQSPHSLEGYYFKSLVCAVRVSATLLDAVTRFKNANGRLIFAESLFNSVAMKERLLVQSPIEMAQIHHQSQQFTFEDINPDHLFHPVKDLHLQEKWREMLP